MTHSLSYTLTRGEDEIELTIEYSVAAYYPAQTYGPPEDCSPAEGGEVEEMEALDADGSPFELTQEEQEKIEQHIYETHDYNADDCGDY